MEWNSRGIQGSQPSLLSWVLSRSKGWGQEEGAAGIPGEVTLFPYICVQRPSEPHTCKHSQVYKCVHMHIHSHVHCTLCTGTHRYTDWHMPSSPGHVSYTSASRRNDPHEGLAELSWTFFLSLNLSPLSGPDPIPDLDSPTSQEAGAHSPAVQEPRKGMAEQSQLFSPPRWMPVEKREGRWWCQDNPNPPCVVFNNWLLVQEPWCSVHQFPWCKCSHKAHEQCQETRTGLGVGGIVLETSSNMALGGPCPGVWRMALCPGGGC